MSDDFILIKHENLIKGIDIARRNAESFFEYSKMAYMDRKHQSSIPLSTISIEESKKGIELAVAFSNGKHITNNEWSNLTNHNYKLKQSAKVAKQIVESFSESEHQNQFDNLEAKGIHIDRISKDDMLKQIDSMKSIDIKLQKLREMCFYGNWNKNSKCWQSFYDLIAEDQDTLTFYVLNIARIYLWSLHDILVELELNLKELDPTSESKEIDNIKKDDHEKLERGEKILSKFIV